MVCHEWHMLEIYLRTVLVGSELKIIRVKETL
jgi:hypothetical protein